MYSVCYQRCKEGMNVFLKMLNSKHFLWMALWALTQILTWDVSLKLSLAEQTLMVWILVQQNLFTKVDSSVKLLLYFFSLNNFSLSQGLSISEIVYKVNTWHKEPWVKKRDWENYALISSAKPLCFLGIWCGFSS